MRKIGVLRGGTGDEYFLSLKSGAQIMKALNDAGYDVLDMLVDRNGILHIKGIPTTLETAASQVDVVWNAIHGEIGEDGKIQALLDDIGIPYSGAGATAAALTANKMTAKERAREIGIRTPEAMLIMPEGGESIAGLTQSIYRRMAPPWVVKPLVGGASIHTYLATTPLELSQFVEESISYGQPFIVEQYIFGKEANVGVVDGLRGQEPYVLPVVEMRRPSRGILTHDELMQEGHAVVGGSFRADERERLSALAEALHRHFGVSDYSQSAFIIDRYGKIWYLETDSIPHLTDQGAFVTALKSVGSSLGELVRTIIGRK
ncbi:MAG TPA: hypothetical protein VG621_00185 [Candidatus Paceibacterota bacterium]|nr:hypothetical protein [Candidatus Paceibacterota bacterium]